MRAEIQRLPPLFLERLRRIIPHPKWDAVVNLFAETRPTTFRVNTLKVGVTHAALLQERLQHQGFRLERVPWYPDAFMVRGAAAPGRTPLRALQETEAYQKGEIYVQSLSSMVPPLALDPKPGETVLDLTAAPGSKTTQMAALMKGEGRIVANDNSRIRFFKLKANVGLQGTRNVELPLRHGESFGRDFPDSFDRILLDAPCSAEGRFKVQEPSSYRYWKPAKIKEMVRKQKRLFFSAFSALRPGGVLVYSTCTFAPEENEGVLDWALEKFGERVTLEKPPLSLPNQMSALGAWEGRRFHPEVRSAVRLLPASEMEGFFIARIRKREGRRRDAPALDASVWEG